MSSFSRRGPARVDRNQAAIVAGLRQRGRLVEHLHMVGEGCPDLLIGCPSGRLVLLEVKAPGGRLTPRQVSWFEMWAGYPAFCVFGLDEALAVTM